MKDKVVLAYSGGLDTTAIIPWLKAVSYTHLSSAPPFISEPSMPVVYVPSGM